MQSAARVVSKEVRQGMRMIQARNYNKVSYAEQYPLTVRQRHAIGADMDSMPKPFGVWQVEYAARQKKYNMHLAASLVAFALSLYYAFVADVVCLPNVYAPLDLEAVYQERLARQAEEEE